MEHEQQGKVRAEYGKNLLQNLSQRLTEMFGIGFDVTNLRKMRQFYQAFPIRDTVCLELSWSYYCRLIQVDNEQARQWYLRILLLRTGRYER